MINNTFSNLADPVLGLKAEDQLFVFVSADGNYNAFLNASEFNIPVINSNNITHYTSSQLVNDVRFIGCAQMIFVFQVRYSGHFKTALLQDVPNSSCKNRIIQTATDTLVSARMEYYINGGNCGEFTFYLAAAARGYYMYDYIHPMKWGCRVGDYLFNDPAIQWGSIGHPPDYNPDNGDPTSIGYLGVTKGNADGYTQFIEAFNYANCMDSWSDYGYSNPLWFFILNDKPQYGIDKGFTVDDLFCMNGIAGNTSTGTGTQQVLARSYLLGGNLNVHSNMDIQENASITIGVDNADIDVDQYSTFQVGSGFTLKGGSSNTNGLNILNPNNPLNLQKNLFSSINLMNYGSLTIGSVPASNPLPTFNNCYSLASIGDVLIENSDFNNSTVYLGDDPSSSHTATVDNCHFATGTTAIDNLAVTHLKNYSITNNVFYGGLYAIGLYYDGSSSGNNLVQNNQISNCMAGGLFIYQSSSSLDMNHIHDIHNTWAAGNGVSIMDNNSNVSMTGSQSAQDHAHTQEIIDCDGLEIYATNNCLPYYMKYNAIIDEDRQEGDPLLFYDNKPTNQKFDVTYNCWGQHFDPSQDLHANSGYFKPYPTWCPSGGGIQTGPDADMYNTAINYVDSSNFSEAMNLFQLLVVTYPKSLYAQASMKAMFETEFYAGNDFSDLKMFYLTNDSILADTSLTQLGDFLANECDIQMQNYGSAISWYENRIQNSTDPNDSVFAIIDLGDLYTIMDTTGNKPIFIGSMPQYRPKSKAQYVAYRDSLIFLLPFTKDPLEKNIKKLQNGQLLQNIPNPSSSSTDFHFRLFGAANADIRIYDSWGRLKQVIPITNLRDGIQKITFNTSNLPSGIYEYALTINEKRTDIKKMIVIR